VVITDDRAALQALLTMNRLTNKVYPNGSGMSYT
jgi:hypothetical protein